MFTVYVTFHKKGPEGRNLHRAIPCDSLEEAHERAEALSHMSGYRNVGINQCGRLPAGAVILKPKSATTVPVPSV